MEIKEFKSFRDYDRKFVKVTNIGAETKKSLKIEKIEEPIFGVLYIDKSNGITLRILGNETSEIKDEVILLRANAFGKANFEIFKGNDYLKDVLNNQINKLYYDKNREELLADKNLDEFRHEEYPDDVMAILPNDNQPESIWVRLLKKTNEDNLYIAKLLDDSHVDKNYFAGITVALILYDEDDFKGLIINGLVKIM